MNKPSRYAYTLGCLLWGCGMMLWLIHSMGDAQAPAWALWMLVAQLVMYGVAGVWFSIGWARSRSWHRRWPYGNTIEMRVRIKLSPPGRYAAIDELDIDKINAR